MKNDAENWAAISFTRAAGAVSPTNSPEYFARNFFSGGRVALAVDADHHVLYVVRVERLRIVERAQTFHRERAHVGAVREAEQHERNLTLQRLELERRAVLVRELGVRDHALRCEHA